MNINQKLADIKKLSKNTDVRKCVDGLTRVVESNESLSNDLLMNLVNESLFKYKESDESVKRFFLYEDRMNSLNNYGIKKFISKIKNTKIYENDLDTSIFVDGLESTLKLAKEYKVVDSVFESIKKYEWNNQLRNSIKLIESNIQKGILFKMIAETIDSLAGDESNSAIIEKLNYAFYLPESDAKHYLLSSLKESISLYPQLATLFENIQKISKNDLEKITFVTSRFGRKAVMERISPVYIKGASKFFLIGRSLFESKGKTIRKCTNGNGVSESFLRLCDAFTYMKQDGESLLLESSIGKIKFYQANRVKVVGKLIGVDESNNRSLIEKNDYRILETKNTYKLLNENKSYTVLKKLYEDSLTNGIVEPADVDLTLNGEPVASDFDSSLAELSSIGLSNDDLNLLAFIKSNLGEISVLKDILTIVLPESSVQLDIVKLEDGVYLNISDNENGIDLFINTSDKAKLAELSQTYNVDLISTVQEAEEGADDVAVPVADDDEEAQNAKKEKEDELNNLKSRLNDLGNNIEKIELLDDGQKTEDIQALYNEMKTEYDNLSDEIKGLEAELNDEPTNELDDVTDSIFGNIESIRINNEYVAEIDMNTDTNSTAIDGDIININEKTSIFPSVEFEASESDYIVKQVYLQVANDEMNDQSFMDTLRTKLEGTKFKLVDDKISLGIEPYNVDTPTPESVKNDITSLVGLLNSLDSVEKSDNTSESKLKVNEDELDNTVIKYYFDSIELNNSEDEAVDYAVEMTGASKDKVLDILKSQNMHEDNSAMTIAELDPKLQDIANEIESSGHKIVVTDKNGFTIDGLDVVNEIFIDEAGDLKCIKGVTVEDLNKDEVMEACKKKVNESETPPSGSKLSNEEYEKLIGLCKDNSIDDLVNQGYKNSDVIAASHASLKRSGLKLAKDGDRIGDDPSSKQYPGRTLENSSDDKFNIGDKVIVNTGGSDSIGTIGDGKAKNGDMLPNGFYWEKLNAYQVKFDNGTSQYIPKEYLKKKVVNEDFIDKTGKSIELPSDFMDILKKSSVGSSIGNPYIGNYGNRSKILIPFTAKDGALGAELISLFNGTKYENFVNAIDSIEGLITIDKDKFGIKEDTNDPINLKTFDEIKNKVHDASGVDNPEDYKWYEYKGVWYPETKSLDESLTDDQKSDIENLEKQIKDLEDKKTEFTESTDENKTKIEELNKEIDDLKNNIKSIKGDTLNESADNKIGLPKGFKSETVDIPVGEYEIEYDGTDKILKSVDSNVYNTKGDGKTYKLSLEDFEKLTMNESNESEIAEGDLIKIKQDLSPFNGKKGKVLSVEDNFYNVELDDDKKTKLTVDKLDAIKVNEKSNIFESYTEWLKIVRDSTNNTYSLKDSINGDIQNAVSKIDEKILGEWDYEKGIGKIFS